MDTPRNSINQKQTKDTFSFKWNQKNSYESDRVRAEIKRWGLERYFDNDFETLKKFIGNDNKKFLDAGCGSGSSTAAIFGDTLSNVRYFAIDISDAIDICKQRFHKNGLKGDFTKCSINNMPNRLDDFDIIFSDGVLHHTDNTEESILDLSKRLKKGGKFLFYVYIKKAPIREFTDDYIRDNISTMDNQEAWNTIMSLTKLGKKLGELDIEISIDEDIPILGIRTGTYNLQRLFYYKICKAYYRKEYSLEEMNHVNFDWFMPKNCFRHTPEEIEIFCEKASLKIERMKIEEAGISVIASKS